MNYNKLYVWRCENRTRRSRVRCAPFRELNSPHVSPHSQEVLLQQCLCLAPSSEFTTTRIVLRLHHLHFRQFTVVDAHAVRLILHQHLLGLVEVQTHHAALFGHVHGLVLFTPVQRGLRTIENAFEHAFPQRARILFAYAKRLVSRRLEKRCLRVKCCSIYSLVLLAVVRPSLVSGSVSRTLLLTTDNGTWTTIRAVIPRPTVFRSASNRSNAKRYCVD